MTRLRNSIRGSGSDPRFSTTIAAIVAIVTIAAIGPQAKVKREEQTIANPQPNPQPNPHKASHLLGIENYLRVLAVFAIFSVIGPLVFFFWVYHEHQAFKLSDKAMEYMAYVFPIIAALCAAEGAYELSKEDQERAPVFFLKSLIFLAAGIVIQVAHQTQDSEGSPKNESLLSWAVLVVMMLMSLCLAWEYYKIHKRGKGLRWYRYVSVFIMLITLLCLWYSYGHPDEIASFLAKAKASTAHSTTCTVGSSVAANTPGQALAPAASASSASLRKFSGTPVNSSP